MKRPPAALLIAALAAPASAQPIVPSVRVPAMINPVPLAEAIGEFEHVCLAADFDRARFVAAIGASRWRFVAEAGMGSPAPDVRRAPQGVIALSGPPVQEERVFSPGQCNLETVLRPAAPRADMLAALEAALMRGLGHVPPRRDLAGETCWRWQATADYVDRLCLMSWPERPDHLALSHQRWTPRAEQRAHLAPPAGQTR
jgi:hypothetical protein